MNNISSKDNPLIKKALRLGKKNRDRLKESQFVIDGAREVAEALAAGYDIPDFIFCPELSKELPKSLEGIKEKNIVTEDLFRSISYKENPDGCFAIANMKRRSLEDIDLGLNPLLVILEKVEKPGNIGAILRTAYAAGADGIIINDSQTDIYNPNVIRASEGMVFKVPAINAGISETKEFLANNKIKIFATALIGTESYLQGNYEGPTAFLFGSEADGLSQEWLDLADRIVRIPMKPGIDSLNVSISAAIMLFEAVRQRQNND